MYLGANDTATSCWPDKVCQLIFRCPLKEQEDPIKRRLPNSSAFRRRPLQVAGVMGQHVWGASSGAV